jgi:hypothetical protein
MIEIGCDPDFAAERAGASGRSFRLPRRSDLGQNLIMRHNQERATLPGLT